MQEQAMITSAYQTAGNTHGLNTPALQTHISFPIANQEMGQTVTQNIRDSTEFGGKRIGGKGGSRIKVAVRIRPLLDSELNQGHNSTCIQVKE